MWRCTISGAFGSPALRNVSSMFVNASEKSVSTQPPFFFFAFFGASASISACVR